MTAKSRLSNSLQRLLSRGEEGSVGNEDWIAWLTSPLARKGHLTLTRAGEEVFTSLPLAAHRDGNGGIVLIVDSLLPTPSEEFWHEPVTLHGRLVAFEDGIEQIVTFTASVGERIEHESRPAVELINLLDLERTAHEFVADLSGSRTIELGLIWFGEWVSVQPSRVSISRIFFDETLDGEIGPDGYAVPKATLKIEADGPEVPVRLQLLRARGHGHEAVIEKIDGVARQKLAGIVEETWRVASGLSQRREKSQQEIGYRSRDHDVLAEAFTPRTVLLGTDKRWKELLRELGEVTVVSSTDLDAVSEAVSETRTDLILGDADLWGRDAVRVERLLRSVAKFRTIPRLWISSEPEQSYADGDAEKSRDLVDFGAWDLLNRNSSDQEAHHRLRWAISGDALGEGTTALLVSTDSRMRYRLALGVASPSLRLIAFSRREGLLPTLEKRKPRWVLLDANSFEVEVDSMLNATLNWAGTAKAKVIVLSRGASQAQVTKWMKAGASDIVLTDPSLRQAVERLQHRLYGAHS
ncbi:MAG: hypothetical protein V2A56_04935 [bacterium]